MNILLSSIGRRDYLIHYFRQALHGKGKVIATNCFAETVGMKAADVSEVVPPAMAPEFVPSMLEVCRKHEIRLLISLNDWEGPFLSEVRDQFMDAGVLPIVPSPEITNICLDKYQSWKFFEAHGVPSRKTFLNTGDVVNKLSMQELHLPLILKPRWGQGSVGQHKVYTAGQLESVFDLIQFDLQHNGLKYYPYKHRDNQVLLQEFVDGTEYGVDIVNDLDGKFITSFVKRKFGLRAGETDSAEIIQSPEVEHVAESIATATKHPGIMDVDLIVTENNQITVLDMNPRFGGGYPFAHQAGANIPAALIAWAEGQTPDPDWFTVRYGKRYFKGMSIVS